MKITKLGHCCLLIETEGKRILTDPGVFTAEVDMPESIDLVVISHEHQDHLHTDSLKAIIARNPAAIVVCNSSVGKLLDQHKIPYRVLEGSAQDEIDGIFIKAHDAKHAEIYKNFGQVQNTGYFITNDLFYPGDSFEDPVHYARILALPSGGPWCKVGDAIRFALKIAPEKAFPVHDGIEREDRVGFFHSTLQKALKEDGNIDFIPLKGGESADF